MNNFRGDLTDVSAKKEALVFSSVFVIAGLSVLSHLEKSVLNQRIPKTLYLILNKEAVVTVQDLQLASAQNFKTKSTIYRIL